MLEYPVVAVPRLHEDQFVEGDGDMGFAVHPMAGYGTIIVTVDGWDCPLVFLRSDGMGSYQVYEYVNEEDGIICYMVNTFEFATVTPVSQEV
jgi:hypothetical protein